MFRVAKELVGFIIFYGAYSWARNQFGSAQVEEQYHTTGTCPAALQAAFNNAKNVIQAEEILRFPAETVEFTSFISILMV